MNIFHKIPTYITRYVIFYWTATLLSELIEMWPANNLVTSKDAK